jgi:hypothetical protein
LNDAKFVIATVPHAVAAKALFLRVNIAYIELVLVALLDYGQAVPPWLKKISHGIVPVC